MPSSSQIVRFSAGIVLVTVFAGLLLAVAASPGIAQDAQENETDQDDDVVCEGTPQMSQTSVTSPQDTITADDPAVVEANFRTDPTVPDGCTVMVDLEFSFTDAGYQWGGGAAWDQATTDLLVGTFEVSPGEIRDIRGELHTNGAEAGDEVTVVADYEIWYEGDIENSRQQSGIRHTITVDEPNPADDEGDDEQVGEEEQEGDDGFGPGFGIPAAIAGIGASGYLLKRRFQS